MKTGYSYAIIKANTPAMETERAFLHNKYKKTKKYAYINKVVNNDGSELIAYIDYSNDIGELQKRANELLTWYNYPVGIMKNIQGYLSEI